ncbi:hypothetical protein L6164_004251 [Bauhinia variegata]|uniref:Uncharacterized protein n=1 Tax=Bauhinia variegata TaxID=167791 RepID=A0ACB9Q398_BAUVA|nr:hypothetical protein L6164_004251 [Bauhinia variegata]
MDLSFISSSLPYIFRRNAALGRGSKKEIPMDNSPLLLLIVYKTMYHILITDILLLQGLCRIPFNIKDKGKKVFIISHTSIIENKLQQQSKNKEKVTSSKPGLSYK